MSDSVDFVREVHDRHQAQCRAAVEAFIARTPPAGPVRTGAGLVATIQSHVDRSGVVDRVDMGAVARFCGPEDSEVPAGLFVAATLRLAAEVGLCDHGVRSMLADVGGLPLAALQASRLIDASLCDPSDVVQGVAWLALNRDDVRTLRSLVRHGWAPAAVVVNGVHLHARPTVGRQLRPVDEATRWLLNVPKDHSVEFIGCTSTHAYARLYDAVDWTGWRSHSVGPPGEADAVLLYRRPGAAVPSVAELVIADPGNGRWVKPSLSSVPFRGGDRWLVASTRSGSRGPVSRRSTPRCCDLVCNGTWRNMYAGLAVSPT